MQKMAHVGNITTITSEIHLLSKNPRLATRLTQAGGN